MKPTSDGELSSGMNFFSSVSISDASSSIFLPYHRLQDYLPFLYKSEPEIYNISLQENFLHAHFVTSDPDCPSKTSKTY
jgi:hypothetical protein